MLNHVIIERNRLCGHFVYACKRERSLRRLRRQRVFRDRTNRLEVFSDRELINRYHFPRRTIFDFIQMVNTTSRPTIRSYPKPVSSIVRNIADIEPNVYIVAQAFHTPTHTKKWIMFSILKEVHSSSTYMNLLILHSCTPNF